MARIPLCYWNSYCLHFAQWKYLRFAFPLEKSIVIILVFFVGFGWNFSLVHRIYLETFWHQNEVQWYRLMWKMTNLESHSVFTDHEWNWSLHCVKSVEIRSCFWSVFSCIWTEYRKIQTKNNSVFGHFSRSAPLFLRLQMRHGVDTYTNGFPCRLMLKSWLHFSFLLT